MTLPMTDPRYVLIDRSDVDFIITALKRAHTRCDKARTIDYSDPEQDRELSYPATSGYAMGTMQYVMNMLSDVTHAHDIEVTRLIMEQAITT